MAAERLLGAVLAGGASSRFGSDKALAMIGGETLLARAKATLAPVCEAVVVVGRQGGVPDWPAAGVGPLGGIAGALFYAEHNGFDSVLTIACDMPTVPEPLLRALLDCAPSYCADAPVLGHWPVTLASALFDHPATQTPTLRARPRVHPSPPPTSDAHAAPWMPGRARHDGSKRGALSVRRWAETIGAFAIPAPTPLANINTPADLAAL